MNFKFSTQTIKEPIFLVRLWERDGMSQTELTKSSGLKQPTVVRCLDRMERDGLLERVSNNNDRRVFNFYLTAKAKKACKRLERHANTMNSIARQNLAKKDVEKLNQLVSLVINNLEKFLEN